MFRTRPLLHLHPSHAFIGLLIGSCAAGSAALFAKISPLDPIITAFWRFALATPVFLLLLALPMARGHPGAHPGRHHNGHSGSTLTTPSQHTPSSKQVWPQNIKDWGLMALAGVCFAVSQILWFLGLEHSSVANATLLLALTPIIAGLILGSLFGEPIGRRFWAGMVCALCGIAGLTMMSSQAPGLMLYGDLLCLGAAICLSGYFISLSRLRRRFHAVPVMSLSAVACTVILLVVTLIHAPVIESTPIWPTNAYGWWVVVGLALVSQLFGHGLMTLSIGFLASRLAAVSVLIQPVWASALGWWLLGEALTVTAIISGIFVLIGIWLANQGTTQSTASHTKGATTSLKKTVSEQKTFTS
ncbi:MAG: DMT family transporter [Pseudomonadota bacterium]